MDKELRKKLETLGLIKSTEERIGEFVGFLLIVALLGWAIVSFFHLNWGQAIVISYMFNSLINVIFMSKS